MASPKISQRDARKYRDRVDELERERDAQRSNWSNNYPGGVHIATETNALPVTTTSIKVARQLGHAVVAIQGPDEVHFYALPLPKGSP